MNVGLISIRVASKRRDAQNGHDGAALRSSVAAVTPSQQQLCRSSTTTWRSTGRLIVASLLEVLMAAPRGGTRWQLEEGRELRAAASSQQHQLRRSSRSRRRQQCPATMSAVDGGALLLKFFQQDDHANCHLTSLHIYHKQYWR